MMTVGAADVAAAAVVPLRRLAAMAPTWSNKKGDFFSMLEAAAIDLPLGGGGFALHVHISDRVVF